MRYNYFTFIDEGIFLTPQELKKHYKSNYRFAKETGYAPNTLRHWLRRGYVPEGAQLILERITKGLFKAEINESE